jgi:hypothetical protein
MLAQIQKWEDDENQRRLSGYLREAEGWANGNGLGKPISPFRIDLALTFDPIKLETVYTQQLLTNLQPESFKPVPKTDVAAVGGRVGAEMAHAKGRFYVKSGSVVANGDTKQHNGSTFVYVHPERTFYGFWVKV